MPKRRKGNKWTVKKAKQSISWENALKSIYTSVGHSGAFSSSPKVLQRELSRRFKISNVSVDQISNWLNEQYSHSLHKRAEIHFKRNPIIASDIDNQWQGDLLFLDDLKHHNKGYKMALIVIDVVSRYMWGELMKNKSASSTTEAFDKILKRAHPRKPIKLQTDKGTEFLNKSFQTYLKDRDIIFFTTFSDTKAAIAERSIQTLKKLLYKYMDEMNTKEYHSVFQKVIDTYNSTVHSAIKMPPADVSKDNVGAVLTNLYGFLWEADLLKTRRPLFRINDYVRVSKIHSNLFRKSYKGNWTNEIFQISSIKNTLPQITFGIKDLKGNEIMGSYYENELQKIPNAQLNQQFWEIEKILKIKTLPDKKKEYFVKWVGHDDSHNSWISSDKMKQT